MTMSIGMMLFLHDSVIPGCWNIIEPSLNYSPLYKSTLLSNTSALGMSTSARYVKCTASSVVLPDCCHIQLQGCLAARVGMLLALCHSMSGQ